jgi:hypothetical protein
MLVVKKNCRMLNVQSMFVKLIEYIMSIKTNNIHIYLEMYVACLLPLSVSSAVISSTDNVILTRVHVCSTTNCIIRLLTTVFLY